ncbi:uncharacterized protein CcaverHIS019_0502260 [Cutaneotrichosporon cavernicola]|uniref:Protein transport protein BOS1 n=1 Tax=Cutaneotrichosporon cavernicola TaxID=279322 RepID=A0AA48QWQ2_9TREE|nr:uncharacterized protein CcaverHIS019_0502260 [Cutaneotrichosporon cavernicola]BEI92598.1 hypothetical protein CcaverHIS019_0502260 [Cutaneotrichosporon cavernicola]BEJ00373.1 hypothetical protein CcaverHIS631_0502300 [Cutaneotrichosporon cavernicola]
MNSLNALGNRQVASLQADLGRMESSEGGPSVQGQITTTLAALSRLIDDYDSMARKEMQTATREKANTRVAKLKNEHKELKARFERAKSERDIKLARNDLLGTASGIASGPAGMAMRRGQANHTPDLVESPFAGRDADLFRPNNEREDYALREHSFIRESEGLIDGYIAQGQAVLGNLVEQRGMLKGAKTRLLNTANTLGLSRETISWVERRTTQDAYIFFGGAAFTLFSFWVIWHYLG